MTRILVTHPDLALSGLSVEDKKALAAEGAQMLLEQGISADEISTMIVDNPARLLDLP